MQKHTRGLARVTTIKWHENHMPCFFSPPSHLLISKHRGRYYHLTCSIFYFLPEVGFNDLDDGGDYDNATSVIISDVFEFKREERKAKCVCWIIKGES